MPKEDISVGDLVSVSNSDGKQGYIRFKGRVKLRRVLPGTWVGIELTVGEGDCDGSFSGTSYFKCPQGKGKFLPITRVSKIVSARNLREEKLKEEKSAPKPSKKVRKPQIEKKPERRKKEKDPEGFVEEHDHKKAKIGDRVKVPRGTGTIRYIGPVKRWPGNWFGIELDEPFSKGGNGKVSGNVYFTCPEKRGAFVQRIAKLYKKESFEVKRGYRNMFNQSKVEKPNKFTTYPVDPLVKIERDRREQLMELRLRETIASLLKSPNVLREEVLQQEISCRFGEETALSALWRIRSGDLRKLADISLDACGFRTYSHSAETQMWRKKLTLNVIPGDPHSACVRLLTRLVKLPISEVDVTGKTREEEYTKKVPSQLAPSLEDDAFFSGTIWESNTIMRYLCDRYDSAARYFSKEPIKRALCNAALDYRSTACFPRIEEYLEANPTKTKELEQATENLKQTLTAFEDYFLYQRRFAGGEDPNIADFQVATDLEYLRAKSNGAYVLSSRLRSYLNDMSRLLGRPYEDACSALRVVGLSG